MYLFRFLVIFTIFFFYRIRKVMNIQLNSKIKLKPIELVDMIAEEQRKNKRFSPSYLIQNETHEITDRNSADTVPFFKDFSPLRNRKLWSRWGKWGECSVTCGNGTVTRRRYCISGHCASGEMEIQNRPCVRPPCEELPLDDNVTFCTDIFYVAE